VTAGLAARVPRGGDPDAVFDAFAAPPSPVPSIPQNCHEWNALLHIDNVRSCDGS
jgi:hypothetical protein